MGECVCERENVQETAGMVLAGSESHNNDYVERQGQGQRRSNGKEISAKAKKKCRTRGAAAPAAWIVDPRPSTAEGCINDEDLQEEEFCPSQRIPEGHANMQPEPETQVLSFPSYHFVLDLVFACWCPLSDTSNEGDPIMRIFQFLEGGIANAGNGRGRIGTIMAVDSLDNLAARCALAEENMAITDFVFMINAIQLRCKVIRFVLLLLIV